MGGGRVSRSDETRTAPDARYRPAGPGMAITWRCNRCQQPRPVLGSRGVGIRRLCAMCVKGRAE